MEENKVERKDNLTGLIFIASCFVIVGLFIILADFLMDKYLPSEFIPDFNFAYISILPFAISCILVILFFILLIFKKDNNLSSKNESTIKE
jgi:hypothetical protein